MAGGFGLSPGMESKYNAGRSSASCVKDKQVIGSGYYITRNATEYKYLSSKYAFSSSGFPGMSVASAMKPDIGDQSPGPYRQGT
jgi:hypothetical protein